MPGLDDYDLKQELARGAFAAVWAGKRKVDGASVVIKIREVTTDAVLLDGTPGESLQPFLQSAEIQKRLASLSKNWAPILEIGQSEGRAWYITETYPRSLSKLFFGRSNFSPASLYQLMNGIVHGLLDIGSKLSRPHGNLKPGNVLITGQGDLSDDHVLLTDPAGPEDSHSTSDEADDRYALGLLLYQAVTHKIYGGFRSWPVTEEDESWKRLGKHGPKWLELCNRLLARTPQERPESLATIAAALEAFKPRRALVPRKILLISAGSIAAGLLITVVAGFLWWNQVCSNWSEWLRIHDQWAKTFVPQFQNISAENRARVESHPQGAKILALVDSADIELHPARFADPQSAKQKPPEKPPFWGSSWHISKALDKLNELDGLLKADDWPDIKKLRDALALHRKEGWTSCADYLDGKLKPLDDSKRIAGLETILQIVELQPLLLILDDVEKQWNLLNETSAGIESQANGALGPLKGIGLKHVGKLQDSVKRSPAEMQGISALRDRLRELSEENQLFLSALQGWKNVDEARFAIDNSWKNAPDDSALLAQEIELYQKRALVEDRKSIADTRKMFADVETPLAQLAEITELAAEVAPFQKSLEAERTELKKLSERGWVEKDLREQMDVKSVEPIQNNLAELQVRIEEFRKGLKPDVWLADQRAWQSAESTLTNAWREWMNDLPGQQTLVDDLPNYFKLKRKVAGLQEKVRNVETLLTPRPVLEGAFETSASTFRAMRLEQAIALLKPVEFMSSAQSVEFETLATDYADWHALLKELSGEVALVQSALDNVRQVDGELLTGSPTTLAKLGAKWSDSPALLDRHLKPVIEPLLQRIVALQSLSLRSVEEIVSESQQPHQPEWFWWAWRAMHRAGEWPAQPDDLPVDIVMAERVAIALAGIKSSRRDELMNERRALLHKHFIDIATTTQSDGGFAALDAIAARFSLRDAQGKLDSTLLDDRLLFNFALWQLRASSGKLSDTTPNDDVQKIWEQFSDAAGKSPRIEALGKEYKSLGVRPALTGPGEVSKQWTRKVLADGVVAFEYRAEPDSFTADPEITHRLTFVPVLSDNTTGVTSYLCTTELPITLATDLAATNEAWTAMLPSTPIGPCVWKRSRKAIDRATLWGDKIAYPRSLSTAFNRFSLKPGVGNNPLPLHPVQQLNATAAMQLARLLNCRLPTTREWQIAYAKFEKPTPESDWNLRDQTWLTQKSFATETNATESDPTRGAMPPDVPAKASNALVGNDGTLFYRTVDQGGGKTFIHMIGNVAEFVHDDPAAFDTDRGENMPTLLAAGSADLGVIGASSLSQPDGDPTIPRRDISATQAYSDVGIRLAMWDLTGLLAPRFKTLIDKTQYALPENTP